MIYRSAIAALVLFLPAVTAAQEMPVPQLPGSDQTGVYEAYRSYLKARALATAAAKAETSYQEAISALNRAAMPAAPAQPKPEAPQSKPQEAPPVAAKPVTPPSVSLAYTIGKTAWLIVDGIEISTPVPGQLPNGIKLRSFSPAGIEAEYAGRPFQIGAISTDITGQYPMPAAAPAIPVSIAPLSSSPRPIAPPMVGK